MKKLLLLLAIGVSFILTGCNIDSDKLEQEPDYSFSSEQEWNAKFGTIFGNYGAKPWTTEKDEVDIDWLLSDWLKKAAKKYSIVSEYVGGNGFVSTHILTIRYSNGKYYGFLMKDTDYPYNEADWNPLDTKDENYTSFYDNSKMTVYCWQGDTFWYSLYSLEETISHRVTVYRSNNDKIKILIDQDYADSVPEEIEWGDYSNDENIKDIYQRYLVAMKEKYSI